VPCKEKKVDVDELESCEDCGVTYEFVYNQISSSYSSNKLFVESQRFAEQELNNTTNIISDKFKSDSSKLKWFENAVYHYSTEGGILALGFISAQLSYKENKKIKPIIITLLKQIANYNLNIEAMMLLASIHQPYNHPIYGFYQWDILNINGNPRKEIFWLEKAANLNHLEAMLILSTIEGEGEDLYKAIKWLKKFVSIDYKNEYQNNSEMPSAQYWIAVYYNQLDDYDNALIWAKKTNIYSLIADTYQNMGNIKEAIKYYEKHLAYYTDNEGFIKDELIDPLYKNKSYDQTAEMVERILFELGELYYNEIKNYKKAIKLFTVAAENYTYPGAMKMLGIMYKNGEGVKKDINHSDYWFKVYEVHFNSNKDYLI